MRVEVPLSICGFSGDSADLGARNHGSAKKSLLKMVLVSCLLLMDGTAGARAAEDSIFMSAFAANDIALTTNPQSSFWKVAPSVYADVDDHGKRISEYRTRISSRWTNKYLYLLFECPYKDLYLKPAPNVTAETYGLWDWDVAELFIGSDFHNIRRYKEFEVSPQREWIDLDVNLDLPDHTVGWSWNSGFQVDARIDAGANIWYGAMRIPFAALDRRHPVAGNSFRVNLFRSQGPPQHRQSITWRPPMADTFHIPERFGLLMLVKAK
jgi:hypothetical protein